MVVSIVLLVGVPGHAFIMVLLALKRRSWSTSDIFILHLGLTDVLLLLTLPFWATQAALPLGWCCGLFWCRINGALFNISFYCGMLLLLFIAGERYLSIVRSVRLFTQKTPRLAHITCLLIWILSVLLSIPDWVSMVYLEGKTIEDKDICSCFANMYTPKWQTPSRILHHVTFLLPVVILAVIFYFILKQLQDAETHAGLRPVMLILTLVLVFLLCWTPYNVTLIVDTWKSRRSKKFVRADAALLATLALACVHACLRPLIYFGLCEKFQERTLAAVKCRGEELKGDLWELGVGSEDVPEQCSNPEEMKQMNNVEQSQTEQC
uniref:G-protein coupled receptors family 1 profile domain-containing protein n=1 Tax=Knipowitschia caucasica TaxID=637954 RepID=A0AAV2MAM0_KNICA